MGGCSSFDFTDKILCDDFKEMETSSCVSKTLKGPHWARSRFTEEALPRKVSKESSSRNEPVPPSVWLEYLKQPKLILKRRSQQDDCAASWAYAITGAVQYSTALAYSRMGLSFENRFMSAEFLLTCYEGGGACGCLGSDLPRALLAVAEYGCVTFSQFPYASSYSMTTKIFSEIQSYYICSDTSHQGTCRPCQASLDDYVESALSASSDQGSFRFTVPCLPCVQPSGPKYFPSEPFLISPSGDAASVEDKVEAIKKELLRVGPLCAAVTVDSDSFASLQAGGSAPKVKSPREGRFYRPRRASPGRYHCVLIVGYEDLSSGGPMGDYDNSFWVCKTSLGDFDFGYTLDSEGHEVDGLFNISMYSEVSEILDRTLSYEKIRILTGPGEEKTELSDNDPLVIKLSMPPRQPQGNSPVQQTERRGDGETQDEGRSENIKKVVIFVFVLIFGVIFLVAFSKISEKFELHDSMIGEFRVSRDRLL